MRLQGFGILVGKVIAEAQLSLDLLVLKGESGSDNTGTIIGVYVGII